MRVIDSERLILHFENAGHSSPIVLRGDEAMILTEGGTVLGLFPKSVYEERQFALQLGRLLVANDGRRDGSGGRTRRGVRQRTSDCLGTRRAESRRAGHPHEDSGRRDAFLQRQLPRRRYTHRGDSGLGPQKPEPRVTANGGRSVLDWLDSGPRFRHVADLDDDLLLDSHAQKAGCGPGRSSHNHSSPPGPGR